jgi:hypothetical protein
MPDITPIFSIPFPEDTDPVTDGAQDMRDIAFTVENLLAAGHRYAGRQVFTASGTFEKANALGAGSGVVARALIVKVQGGGGAGAGAGVTAVGETSNGGGGGAGGYAESFLNPTDVAGLAASENVTVGNGGAGAAGAGSPGTASIFPSFGTGNGGDVGGGAGASTATVAYPRSGGVGGTASGGNTFNTTGQPGSPSINLGTGLSLGITGDGAGSFFGAGGNAVLNGVGVAGSGFGSGGSGARNQSNQATARAGGNGAGGVVIIEVFV